MAEGLMLFFLAVPALFIWGLQSRFQFPVPVHFNAQGQADGYADNTGPFYIPVYLGVFLYLVLRFAPKLDRTPAKQPFFEGGYLYIRLGAQFFIMALGFMGPLLALGYHIGPGAVLLGVLLLFNLIGFSLRNSKPNGVAGIRIIYTLHSPVVWRLTHNFCAWYWLGLSAVYTVVYLFIGISPALIFSFPVLMVAVPFWYARSTYKKLEAEGRLHETSEK